MGTEPAVSMGACVRWHTLPALVTVAGWLLQAASLRVSIKDGVGTSSSDGHAGGLVAGCNDVALVQVEVIDAKGNVVPTAANNVTLSWDKGLAYLGGGNGDPASHVSGGTSNMGGLVS